MSEVIISFKHALIHHGWRRSRRLTLVGDYHAFPLMNIVAREKGVTASTRAKP